MMHADLRFVLSHPAHFLACGFGSGLSPWAPGTAGTLAAWLLYPLIRPQFSDPAFALFLLAGFVLGVFAAARTGRALGVVDHGAIVWDEMVPFWLVLFIAPPDGSGRAPPSCCSAFSTLLSPSRPAGSMCMSSPASA